MNVRILKFALPIGLGLFLCVITFLGLLSTTLSSCSKGHGCPDTSPYYCESGNTCCKYEYYDGHHTCFSTMAACRAGGYQCEVCHTE